MATMQMAGLLANMKMPAGVNPLVVNLPKPPKLEGALKPNSALTNCVKFAENVALGPESMVLSNGYVYTGLSDGNVVELKPDGTLRKKIRRMSMNSCGTDGAGEGACGRPLGVREYKGYLIVADAYHGIIALDPSNGDFSILVDGRLRVNGKRIGGFINDLAIAKDGSIYFTVSSAKYTRKDYLNVILEAETSGRVLVYNRRFPGRVKVRELVTTLNFPNGLQLSKNNDYLLVAEGARFKIHKVYIDRSSPKYGKIEVFADNLPGFVDNIRRSPRGTYWVGLGRARHEGKPSILDQLGNQPKIRGALMSLPKDVIMARASNYGMVIELNEKGEIIRSLHDSTGTKYSAVSEVEEENGMLYIGSFDRNYICRLNVSTLPPIYTPSTGGGTGSGMNQQLANFLNQIRQRLMAMGPGQIRDVVIALVQNLVQVKLDAIKAQNRADNLQKEVNRLQNLLDARTTPTTPAATTTPSSAQGTTTPSGGSGTTGTTSGAGTTTASGTTAAGSGTTQAATSGTTAAGTTSSGSATAGTTASGTTTAAAGTTTAAQGTTTAAGGTTAAAGTTTAAAATTTAAGDTTTAAGTTSGATQAGTTTAAGGTTAAGTTAAGGDSGTTQATP